VPSSTGRFPDAGWRPLTDWAIIDPFQKAGGSLSEATSAAKLPGRAAITLATTKAVYLEMAYTLARSFMVWNRDSGISFHIITDLDTELPADLKDVKLVRIPSGALGKGFSPKLHLDTLAPAQHTLFIDADCLCVGPLNPTFDRFAGRAVSVAGGKISTGLWWSDVDEVCRRIGVASLPKFNGGIYYVEPGELAAKVYRRAREVAPLYDAWNLVRLRGHANDEILMAIAMAEAGLEALPDDDTIMAPFNIYPHFLELDVFAGRCKICNPPPPHRLSRDDLPIKAVAPVIPHFINDYTDHWRYRSEALKLRVVAKGMPLALARLLALCTVVLPGLAVETGKVKLRPVFRKLFGTRRVKLTARV
jgi:hypothetical protein